MDETSTQWSTIFSTAKQIANAWPSACLSSVTDHDATSFVSVIQFAKDELKANAAPVAQPVAPEEHSMAKYPADDTSRIELDKALMQVIDECDGFLKFSTLIGKFRERAATALQQASLDITLAMTTDDHDFVVFVKSMACAVQTVLHGTKAFFACTQMEYAEAIQEWQTFADASADGKKLMPAPYLHILIEGARAGQSFRELSTQTASMHRLHTTTTSFSRMVRALVDGQVVADLDQIIESMVDKCMFQVEAETVNDALLVQEAETIAKLAENERFNEIFKLLIGGARSKSQDDLHKHIEDKIAAAVGGELGSTTFTTVWRWPHAGAVDIARQILELVGEVPPDSNNMLVTSGTPPRHSSFDSYDSDYSIIITLLVGFILFFFGGCAVRSALWCLELWCSVSRG